MKRVILTILMSFFISFSYAQKMDSTQLKFSEIEKALKYKTGVIELESGNAKLTVPEGFGFLDKAQSKYVLTDLFKNPADTSVIGMLVPSKRNILEPGAWFFAISFDAMGYVKDNDAEEINYDDLLKEGQKEAKEENAERIKQGYEPIEFVRWASTPFYDKNKKTLHWAKEIKFGKDSLNTLNYNLRVLGRKGIFVLNAVGSVSELGEVKANIDKVIQSVEFKEGHKYSEFVPDTDNVAAWTIGGLVAGKVLAKAGFFVLILKFWKIIALAVAGAAGVLWKLLTGRKKEETVEVKPDNTPNNT